MITLLVFLLILSVLVLIHEAGHFFMAKKFGIKVEEFGYGIPPRLWGKKIGETIYSINWLPIGGFVKLFGEDDAGAGRPTSNKSKISEDSKVPSKDLQRAFFARPVWQRALVVVAGVVMNAILAAVIYYVFLGMSGFSTTLPLLTNFKFFGVNQTNKLDAFIITGVQKDSPAEDAKLKSCTEKYCLQLSSINKNKIESLEEFRQTIKDQTGKKTDFVFEEVVSKKEIKVSMTPRINPPKGQGSLGIMFDTRESAVLNYETPVQKIFSGITHPVNVMVYQFSILKRLIIVSFEQKTVEPVGSAFSGPVGVFVVTGEVLKIPDLKERFLATLNLAGMLSATLAVFNVLPIPALDGGRLFFIIIEGITRRKVNPQIEAMIHSVGMMLLLGLILVITFKDIFQFFIK